MGNGASLRSRAALQIEILLVMVHDRRRMLHFAVTQHPTAEWTAHQLREAFPLGHGAAVFCCAIATVFLDTSLCSS